MELQYQHTQNSLNTAISKKWLHEILTKMLKDQDKYIEPLAILQQLKFF